MGVVALIIQGSAEHLTTPNSWAKVLPKTLQVSTRVLDLRAVKLFLFSEVAEYGGERGARCQQPCQKEIIQN
eukprot:2059351-Pyramimonas_sp.AAC.2